jgi:hypothetical protein
MVVFENSCSSHIATRQATARCTTSSSGSISFLNTHGRMWFSVLQRERGEMGGEGKRKRGGGGRGRGEEGRRGEGKGGYVRACVRVRVHVHVRACVCVVRAKHEKPIE